MGTSGKTEEEGERGQEKEKGGEWWEQRERDREAGKEGWSLTGREEETPTVRGRAERWGAETETKRGKGSGEQRAKGDTPPLLSLWVSLRARTDMVLLYRQTENELAGVGAGEGPGEQVTPVHTAQDRREPGA